MSPRYLVNRGTKPPARFNWICSDTSDSSVNKAGTFESAEDAISDAKDYAARHDMLRTPEDDPPVFFIAQVVRTVELATSVTVKDV